VIASPKSRHISIGRSQWNWNRGERFCSATNLHRSPLSTSYRHQISGFWKARMVKGSRLAAASQFQSNAHWHCKAAAAFADRALILAPAYSQAKESQCRQPGIIGGVSEFPRRNPNFNRQKHWQASSGVISTDPPFAKGMLLPQQSHCLLIASFAKLRHPGRESHFRLLRGVLYQINFNRAV